MKKSHMDEGEGMCRRYFARWSQVHLGRGVRKRQSTAVSNLSVQKIHNTNPYSSRKTYQSEKEKDKKKCGKNCEKHGKCGCIFWDIF